MAQRFPIVLALALAVPLATAGVVITQSATAAPRADLLVGVVDLAHVYKQYKRSADLELKITEERDRLRKELDELKAVIMNYNKELQMLTEGTETYSIKEDEKDAAVAKFDRQKRRLEEKIKKRWEDYSLQLLEDIETVVKAYAEEQKFNLVLKVDGKPSEESKLLVGLKAVLYHSKELDITAPVVDILNRNFQMNGGKPAPAGAGAGPGGPGAPTPPVKPPADKK